VNDKGVAVNKFVLADINTSRKLANVLYTIDQGLFTSTDWVKDLVKLFDKLAFGDQFDLPNVKTTNVFLNFVKSGNILVLADYPAFIRRQRRRRRGRR